MCDPTKKIVHNIHIIAYNTIISATHMYVCGGKSLVDVSAAAETKSVYAY